MSESTTLGPCFLTRYVSFHSGRGTTITYSTPVDMFETALAACIALDITTVPWNTTLSWEYGQDETGLLGTTSTQYWQNPVVFTGTLPGILGFSRCAMSAAGTYLGAQEYVWQIQKCQVAIICPAGYTFNTWDWQEYIFQPAPNPLPDPVTAFTYTGVGPTVVDLPVPAWASVLPSFLPTDGNAACWSFLTNP